MTDSETHELVGRKRAEYRERKKERAAVRARLGELSNSAETIKRGLEFPELIRWWDGTPMIGRHPSHIIFTTAMFGELTEANIKQLCGDLKRLDAVIASLRQELTALEGEDPDS